ncbi:MAG: hypothetical protein U0411_14810 [Thermodesulfovibrionales bacterium]
MRVALFAAFPHEARHIVRGLRPQLKSRHPCLWRTARHRSLEIDLVLTGMGTLRARKALRHYLTGETPDLVVSAGFCGALSEGAAVGDLIQGARVLLCQEQGGRAVLPEGRQLVLDTSSAPCDSALQSGIQGSSGGCIITLQQKMRKEEVKKIVTYDMVSPVCDMETFPLALLSQQRGIPFLALRAVTDLHDEDIPPDLFRTADEAGNYRTLRALRLLTLQPGLIPSALRLGRASSLAAKNLWRGFREILETLS